MGTSLEPRAITTIPARATTTSPPAIANRPGPNVASPPSRASAGCGRTHHLGVLQVGLKDARDDGDKARPGDDAHAGRQVIEGADEGAIYRVGSPFSLSCLRAPARMFRSE